MVARTCIIALLIVAATLIGLNYVWHRSPASQIVPIRTGDDPAIAAVQTQLEQDYETKGVVYMETLSDTLRRDASRVAGGHTRLFELYNVLADIRCWCRDGTRAVHSFEDRKARLEQWLQKYPSSTTANLAMAELFEYRAWQVVGGFGSLSQAGAAQRQEFEHNLDVATSYVEKLKVTDDPYVAFFALRIKRSSGVVMEDAARLFRESTAAWPQHHQIYFLYAQILGRAFQDEAGRVRFMQELAAAKDDPNKQVGLAYIIGATFNSYPFSNLGVTWPDVQHAYEVRQQLYGWRNRDLNIICYLAIQAKDWPTAQRYMQQIDGHWNDGVWSSQNDFVWNELIVSLH